MVARDVDASFERDDGVGVDEDERARFFAGRGRLDVTTRPSPVEAWGSTKRPRAQERHFIFGGGTGTPLAVTPTPGMVRKSSSKSSTLDVTLPS